jgi:hypothetical protein
MQTNKLLASDHDELDALLKKLFEALGTGEVEQIYQSLDICWARLAMHIRAEHLHLFPSILRAAADQNQNIGTGKIPSAVGIQNTIEQLQSDHNFFMREFSNAIKQMRELRGNERSDKSKCLVSIEEKILDVSSRLRAHNELEESDVYQWAVALLNPAELAALNAQIQRELDNLPPRFGKSEFV